MVAAGAGPHRVDAMMHAADSMARVAVLVIASLAHGCGSVEVRETAEEAAHRAHLALCAAYAPEPASPLWHRLAWALLCPGPA